MDGESFVEDYLIVGINQFMDQRSKRGQKRRAEAGELSGTQPKVRKTKAIRQAAAATPITASASVASASHLDLASSSGSGASSGVGEESGESSSGIIHERQVKALPKRATHG
jgi:hypothetical protein